MASAAAQEAQLWLSSAALALAFWGFVTVWAWVAMRARQGKPVVPYQPRRPVPWQGIDLVVVLAFFILAATAAQMVIEAILGPEPTPPGIAEKASAAHMIQRLLTEGGFSVILACVLVAGAVAPIVEEFLFRVLLQGWLETVEMRSRRRMPTLRRMLPRAALPVGLSSLLFGMMHFRVETSMGRPTYLLAMLIGSSIVGLLALLFAVALLRIRVKATAADFGWVREKFWADVRLGLLAFAGLAGPIYGLQLLLVYLLPSYLAPDPLVLFVFALALGTLYFRTHRAVPSIMLHMALNVTSLVLALLASRL